MSRREPVSRPRALAAAVELADAEGIDAVSMRRLAERLGVVPMALYKHVANKDDLLGGMVDTIIGEYDPPTPGLGWPAAVRARILSARTVLLRHPWARGVIETRSSRTLAVLGYLDSVAGMFLGGGLSADLTHHAMHALGHRVWGFSPEAFDDPRSPTMPPDPAQQREMFDRLQQVFPHIAAISLASGGGSMDGIAGSCDEQFEFEFALDLLLDAVARLHRSGWVSPRHSPA